MTAARMAVLVLALAGCAAAGPRAPIMPSTDARARAALDATPVSVMEKRRTPPSGNKHDYMSMAPYWWPDSTKPDGLPFVRRDGHVYPASRVDHDGLHFEQMRQRVDERVLRGHAVVHVPCAAHAGVARARRAVDRRAGEQQAHDDDARSRLHDLRQLRARLSPHRRCALP